MATFEVANEQLAAIQDFLDVQRRLGMAPSLYDEIENQQACTLARVIARLKSLKAVDAQTLSATLARGNWGAIAKAQLAKVISERVGAQGHAGNGTQECDGFANYPTEDEWRIIMDPSMPRLNKVHAVVDRMLAINLCNPSEQCRKLIASIIGMYVPDASGKELPDDIRFWIQKKRKALKKIASREDIPMIIEYPTTPQEMPEDLFKKAYKKGHSPAPAGFVDLEALPQTMAKFHVRRSHNASSSRVEQKHSAKVAMHAAGPSTSSTGAAPDMQNVLLQFLMQERLKMGVSHGQHHVNLGGGVAAPPPRLEQEADHGNQKRKSFLDAGDDGCDGEGAEENDDEITSMEAAMINSYKGKGTTRTRKRPSAAVLKRPAGSNKPRSSKTLRYKDCTIYTSDSKQGYRVLMPGYTRVDKLFKWSPSKEAALKTVKKAIDDAWKEKKK